MEWTTVCRVPRTVTSGTCTSVETALETHTRYVAVHSVVPCGTCAGPNYPGTTATGAARVGGGRHGHGHDHGHGHHGGSDDEWDGRDGSPRPTTGPWSSPHHGSKMPVVTAAAPIVGVGVGDLLCVVILAVLFW